MPTASTASLAAASRSSPRAAARQSPGVGLRNKGPGCARWARAAYRYAETAGFARVAILSTWQPYLEPAPVRLARHRLPPGWRRLRPRGLARQARRLRHRRVPAVGRRGDQAASAGNGRRPLRSDAARRGGRSDAGGIGASVLGGSLELQLSFYSDGGVTVQTGQILGGCERRVVGLVHGHPTAQRQLGELDEHGVGDCAADQRRAADRV